jgi:hypothetical protein
MEFISEQIIDRVAQQLESTQEGYILAVEEMKKKQPALLAYFLSEDFHLLTEDENEYLLYLGIVIWKSIEEVAPNLPMVSEKELEMAEEINWDLLSHVTSNKFRERMNVFFENYSQEDLLAFVEDALIDDEDSFISKEGREPLFVTLKTVIDALCKI